MKRRDFLSLAAFCAAASALSACGQSSIVTNPVTESESIAVNPPNAVSIAEDTMDYPYLDATQDALQAIVDWQANEQAGEYTKNDFLLDTFGDTHPGICYLELSSYIPDVGGAVGSIAAPNATAMTAQQAANHAAALFHFLYPDQAPGTITLLCLCPDETASDRRSWEAYLSCETSAEPKDFYSMRLQIDAIAGKLEYFSYIKYEDDGSPSIPLQGEDALAAAATEAKEGLDALLRAAGAGQQAGALVPLIENENAFYYSAEIDGESYRISIWANGTVRYVMQESAYQLTLQKSLRAAEQAELAEQNALSSVDK
ncbi:MAG: hypothetical protein LKJ90_03425 [Faecalibacterium sp.]|nr:hypothetical protein [Faecalibacterium sp.]